MRHTEREAKYFPTLPGPSIVTVGCPEGHEVAVGVTMSSGMYTEPCECGWRLKVIGRGAWGKSIGSDELPSGFVTVRPIEPGEED